MAEAKAKKSYILPDGTESRSVRADATTLRFTFTDGTVLNVDANTLPEDIRKMATWHGLAQKIGDSYASAKTVDDAIEAGFATHERLEIGEWLSEREASGPRISHILAALVRARAESGKPLSEAEQAERSEKLKVDKTYRESCLANASVKAALAAIQAERAAERAAELAAKANDTSAQTADNL